MNLEQLFKEKLKRLCLQTTEECYERNEENKKDEPLSNEKIEAITNAICAVSADSSWRLNLSRLLGVVLDSPALMQQNELVVKTFCAVVVQDKDTSGHAYALNVPHIAFANSNGNFCLLHTSGSSTSWYVKPIHKPRYASPDEIEKMVGSLNEDQIRALKSDPNFQALWDESTEVEPGSSQEITRHIDAN